MKDNELKGFFDNAEKKWRLYDNKICHKVSDFVSESDFNVSTFYEFAKGFVFASIDQQAKIDEMRKALCEIAYDVFFNTGNSGAIVDTIWHDEFTTSFDNIAPHLGIDCKDWADMNEVKSKLLEKLKKHTKK